MPLIFQKYRISFRKFVASNVLISISLGSLVALPSAATAQETRLSSTLNEQVVMIHGAVPSDVDLETTIFKPPGSGPFPVVIMNHGKDPGNPHQQKRDRFLAFSKEFIKRGYAVIIPMRKGFSKSSGNYEDYGCNMTANGQLQANDLQNALEYARGQLWVDKDKIVIAGQSYGGLATMAFGAKQVPGVRGLINFAGGLRTDENNCQWQAALVKAFAAYGATNSIPSLWFYGQNDKYFGHEVAHKMHNAYVSSGGNAKLIAFGAFKSDAHGMVGSRDGVKIWWPETEKFLQQIGMPTEEVVAINEEAPIPKSGYAALENVDALPYVQDSGKEAYKAFLSKSLPRAFAVSPSGVWSWAEDGENPVERVMASCQSQSAVPCKLYAVDNNVVWTESPGVPNANRMTAAN